MGLTGLATGRIKAAIGLAALIHLLLVAAALTALPRRARLRGRGLEGRVPFLDHDLVELAATCPPQYKTAHEGKGVLKQAARRVIPADVIDRPKGYFPVPALTHLEGPYLDMVRDALYAPEAKERGLFRPEAVEQLLADPNGRLTPLRGNELWQIGLLELWLQKHGIRGPAV